MAAARHICRHVPPALRPRLSVYRHLTDAIQRLQDAGVTPADGLPGTADEAFDLEFDATPHLQAKLTTAPI